MIVMSLLLLDMQMARCIKSPSSIFSMLCAIIIIIQQIDYAATNAMAAGTAVAEQQQHRELTISECAEKGGECDESKGRPVCGTDEQTYPTSCHLTRAQCSGYQVSLKYRGPCKACKEAREYVLKHFPNGYVPRCKSDGTYAPIQCAEKSGCWCSDFMGKPIANTTVSIGKPDCRRFYKANIRRSPTQHQQQQQQQPPMHRQYGGGGGGGDGGRRLCTPEDQMLFKRNLLQIFLSEYKRVHHLSTAQLEEQAAYEQSIIDWKFNALDVNNNHMLDKQEFRELKKLVRRVVKPKRCGRTFGKMCDNNDDERLTRGEWNACIAKRGASAAAGGGGGGGGGGYVHNLTPSVRRPIEANRERERQRQREREREREREQHLHSHQLLETEEEDTSDYDPQEEDEEEAESGGGAIGGAANSSSLGVSSIYFLRPKPETQLKEADSETDCATEAATLDAQNRAPQHGGSKLFVPECMPDGRRFQRVQCYQTTPYCWCVNETTGQYIIGSSVKNKKPLCNNIGSLPRQMKGCPEPRKTQFLKNLKEYFKQKIIPNANVDVNATNWKTDDERIAYITFIVLDKNKNMQWERKEWKSFRELMTNAKTLRKCGRKMPKYCDANSDKKIVLNEWIECLQPTVVNDDNEASSLTSSSSSSALSSASALAMTGSGDVDGDSNKNDTTKPPKLSGSNPLEQYLKD